MTPDLARLALAAGINGSVAVVARLRRSVTPGGAVAGFMTGAAILYFGGWTVYGTLILFFVSSTILSRTGGSEKSKLTKMHEKGDERDALQVMANGLAGLAGAVLLGATGIAAFSVFAAGGFAAANADTWAGEVGELSHRAPRSLVTWKKVPAGISGGVTLAGTAASAAGALLIGLWYSVGSYATGSGNPVSGGIAVAASGVIGSLIDSALGGSLQALYRTSDGALTERPASDGRNNVLVRGFRFVTNDLVNAVSTIAAACLAWALAIR